jgi:hypothetical protein
MAGSVPPWSAPGHRRAVRQRHRDNGVRIADSRRRETPVAPRASHLRAKMMVTPPNTHSATAATPLGPPTSSAPGAGQPSCRSPGGRGSAHTGGAGWCGSPTGMRSPCGLGPSAWRGVASGAGRAGAAQGAAGRWWRWWASCRQGGRGQWGSRVVVAAGLARTGERSSRARPTGVPPPRPDLNDLALDVVFGSHRQQKQFRLTFGCRLCRVSASTSHSRRLPPRSAEANLIGGHALALDYGCAR